MNLENVEKRVAKNIDIIIQIRESIRDRYKILRNEHIFNVYSRTAKNAKANLIT